MEDTAKLPVFPPDVNRSICRCGFIIRSDAAPDYGTYRQRVTTHFNGCNNGFKSIAIMLAVLLNPRMFINYMEKPIE